MLRMQRPERSSAAAGVRAMLPQSRNTMIRSDRSAGGSVISPSSPMNRYSYGSGNSSAVRNATESLPSAVRMCCIAASEPTASPSGRSCVVSRNLSWSRSVASAWSRVGRAPLSDTRVPPVGVPRGNHVFGLALEQLLDPLRAVERVVVHEVEGRRVLEVQLVGHPPLQVAVRRPQAVERAPAHRSAAQDGHVYPRLAQVWGCIDCCHRDESDPWILQLGRDCTGQDLPHGLVHAPHPAAGHRSDSKSSHDATRRSTRTPCGNRASNIR